MNAEDSLREMLGYGQRRITFMGREFTIQPDGLVPLLRYVMSISAQHDKPGHDVTDEERGNTALAAHYGLLEDCIEDFGAFSALALEAKATLEDVADAVTGLIGYYCARSHWAAQRLLAYIAQHLEEIDGQLIRAGGRGVTSLSAREACNLALAICLDGRDEEDRAIFLDDLNYEGNPEAEALALVRQMQAARASAEAQAAEAARG